jgi:hypothetical protein
LSFRGEGVIASLQGGSPFAEKVFQPDSTKNRVENRPSTCNYEWGTLRSGEGDALRESALVRFEAALITTGSFLAKYGTVFGLDSRGR